MTKQKLNHRVVLLLFVLIFHAGVLSAQVLVHEEPFHHPIFQNQEVRVLNVLIPPGDTSQYHIHHTPSVFIFFTTTNTGSQLQGKAGLAGKSNAGNILFENLASPNLRVHRVWNADRDSFHVMDIELLFKDTGFVEPPLPFSGLKLEIDTSWVRAYKFGLAKGKAFTFWSKTRSFILVSLNSARLQTKQAGKSQEQTVVPGSIYAINKSDSFSVKNLTRDQAEFYLLELAGQR